MKRILLLLPVFICCMPSLHADNGTEIYSVDDCIRLAMENNYQMKNAVLEYGNSMDTKRALFTRYFPQVNAVGSWFTTDNGAAKFVILPGISFPVGKDGLVGGVMAVQPVFAGGRIITGNKLAKVGTEVGRLKLEAVERDVTAEVERYYWLLVSLKEKMKIVKSSETLVDNLEKDLGNLIDAGVKNRNDMLDVLYAKNELESRKNELENGIILSRMALAQYIGMESMDSFDVDTMPVTEIMEPEYYLVDHESALASLPEYEMLLKSVEAKKLEYVLKAGDYMPAVGIGVSYQYQNLLNTNHDFGSVFATVTVPLSGWWEGSYELRKKKREMEMNENEVENARQLLLLRMQKVWNELYQAYRNVELAEKAIEIATENYELNRRSFDAGLLSMSELLESQMKKVESENKRSDAVIEYVLKCREYRNVTGNH